ncbi:MAG: flagellar protein FlaG [Deltaproteobacteria bacterium]|nr:flagellar protein FlaG [Deltaproteobacteria bacterium]
MKITAPVSETQDFMPHIDAGSSSQRITEDAPSANHAHTPGNIPEKTAGSDNAEDISLQKLQNVTEAMDAYTSSLGVSLKFNIDERTDTIQVEVRDPENDKLIRKIPADEMLELAASIEKMVGLFLDKTL